MKPADLVEHLLSLPDRNARRQHLQALLPSLNDQYIESLIQALRDAHRKSLVSDAQRSLQTAELILDIGDCLDDDAYRALGYRLMANAYTISLGQYEDALALYDRAEEILRTLDDELELARMQIVRTWALSFTDSYAEAVRWGAYAYPILEKNGDVRSLAILANNLAMVHNRFGEPDASLQLLNAARDTFRRWGEMGQRLLSENISNRVFVLGMLGRYNEAIEIAQEGLKLAEQFGQCIIYARIQHNLGLIYNTLGHYNQALQLFDQAQDISLADERYHNYVQRELTTTFCLLQLRRFSEVIERCQRVRQLCQKHNVTPETPFSLLNEAQAYVGLGQFENALISLAQTQEWMVAQGEGGLLYAAETDLVKAELLFRQGKWTEAQTVALACVQEFRHMQRLLEVAQAYLVAAQAATATQDLHTAQDFARASLAISEPRNIAALIYQAYAMLGQISRLNGKHNMALAHYERAIAALNQIQGHVMLEFRSDFLADQDKQRVYEATVSLCLALDRPQTALEYVEQAKSRALMDMIARRLDLRLEARAEADEALVSELNRLNARRNTLYRQRLEQPGASSEVLAQQQDIEQRVTALRDKLLVRNADYARDLSLTGARVEPVQPYLASDTLLLEYFTVQERLLAFCVTAQSPCVKVYHLPAKFTQIKQWHQRLRVNLRTVPRSTAAHTPHLIRNAQAVLQRLHEDLLAPLAAQLAAFRRLIIVPHGSLHYIPFHALFDGQKYLIETHQVSYLPASSLLRYSHDARRAGQGMLTVGYSYQGKLPQAVAEAQALGERWQAELVCGEHATRQRVQELMAGRQIIHLATHGEFHRDNPLFSGLALADGWLTTLDVFNLRLDASLVTLSGCHTGRSIIGGGDELLGLMRAFLAAGASTLLLSQWAAEDRATALLMEHFYEQLAGGATKAAALQKAQLGLLDQGAPSCYQHPFFWAPFYLVGDAGAL